MRVVIAGLGLAASLGVAATFSPAGERIPKGMIPSIGDAVGLQFFRLQPTSSDTVLHLLVIPVRFPEDRALGGGNLEARLNGPGSSTLRGYWEATTSRRLQIETQVAPTVVANYPMEYYTTSEEGVPNYGIDPDAYPRNAQGLVEEVTFKVRDSVDFKKYDNTADGIADAVLVLHSGPSVPEASGPPPPGSMLAHSFTTSLPMARGSALVFPYAIAATRDSVGPWAHETGHLFGFPDLYVNNFLCPSEGVGEWSLMATGANRGEGGDPSGLDAFTRQLFGFEPVTTVGSAITLSEGVLLRVFRPGETFGPQYFLVERRSGSNGLGVPVPATVVYYVDETVGDNRNCFRPLVEVRATVCEGHGPCSTLLSDFTSPSLRDGEGEPTGLVLELSRDTVTARYQTLPALHLESVQLGRTAPGSPEHQPLAVRVRNLDTERPITATLDIAPAAGGILCIGPQSSAQYTIPPGDVVQDDSWRLAACSGNGDLPAVTESFLFTLTATGTSFSRTDTLMIPADQVGLPADSLAMFTSHNWNPGRADPWRWEAGSWAARDLDAFALADLVSPWFTVPETGRVVVDHGWDLDALSPDVALDAGQIVIERQTASALVVEPPEGWGYTTEREIGNALAGQTGLSAAGNRIHVLPLDSLAGEPVRVRLRAAGDVDPVAGRWVVAKVCVTNPPRPRFELVQDTENQRILLARTMSAPEEGVVLSLYQSRGAVTPIDSVVTRVPWDGSGEIILGGADPENRRFELVWQDSSGRAASTTESFSFTVAGMPFLAPPFPNPFARGGGQTWSLVHGEGTQGGFYELELVDVAGRLVLARRVWIEVQETRRVYWEGRDGTGRMVPAGVYFLRARRPDGRTESQKILALP